MTKSEGEGRPYLCKVDISDIEKRKFPTKYYVYVITVLWSDGKKQVICRRYNSFFALQTSLIDTFPVESGAKNPKKRIIPFLPGKILIGRSQTREVALKRKQLLDEYVQKLLQLPENIARCDLILDFFEATKEDIENLLGDKVERKRSVKTAENISDPILLEQFIVIADFKKTERNQISLAAGDTVDVVEKHENGWWFVCLEDEQGWVPSSYLEPADGEQDSGKDKEEEDPDMKFICVREYKAKLPDELTIELGDVVDIIKRHHDGWWEVSLKTDLDSAKQHKGFVPVAHLKKVPKSAEAPLAEMKPSEKDRSFAAPPRKKTIKRTIAPRKSAPIKAQTQGILKTPQSSKTEKPPSPMLGRALPPVPAGQAKKLEVEPKKEEEESIYVALRNFKTDDEGSNLTLTKGERLTVIEKSPNGWWLVKVGDEEGWIPSTFVQRQRQKSLRKNSKPTLKYVTGEDFESPDDDGMSFKKGMLVEVIEKDEADDGWWYVSIDGNTGWVPSTYLDELKPSVNEPEPKPDPKRRISNTIEDITETIPITSSGNVIIRDANRSEIPRREALTETLPTEAPGRPTTPKPSRRVQKEPEQEIYGNVINTSKITESVEQNNNIDFDEINNPQIKGFIEGTQYTVEEYVALADYQDDDEGMLNFRKGQIVKIIIKDEEGWWLGECDDNQGWVPSNYLQSK